MPFGMNDEEVKPSFGADDEVVRPPAVKQPVVAEPSQQAPVEKPFNAKEEIPDFVDLMGIGEEAYAPASPEQKLAIKDLVDDPDYFKIISDYKTARFNEPYKEGEDKQQYVEDFMGKMRYNELNVLFGSLPELNWMKNNPDQAKKSALAKMVYEETAGVEDPGGQKNIQPYVDVVKALATDPLNYLGFFVGKGAGAVMSKTAIQPAMKQATAAGVGAVTEGAIGGGANVVEQKTQMASAEALGQQLTPEQKKLDKGQIAAAALITGIMGAGEAAFGARGVGRQAGESLDEYLKKQSIALQNPTAPTTKLEEELADKLVDEAEIKAYGAEILRDLDPSTPLTDAQISREMSKRAVRVAMKIIEVDPTFAFNPNTEKISTAIARVFSRLDEVDDVALESAINYAGLTPDQFAAANKMTVTDAAAIMQQYSVAARMVKRMQEIDPDFKARMDNIYGKNDDYVSPLGNVLEGIKWTEKQSKAFITSGIDTTIRNVAGTNIGLTMKAASDIIDGILYSGGVALNEAKQIALGQPRSGISTKQAAANSVKNAFDTFFYMKNSGLAADVTDKLLENNPSIRNHMLAALQETDKKDVSKLARWANVFNSAQDTFFRRAVFTASVERQLRDQGIDLYKDVLANNKLVPSNILSKAADDSLKATFSYMPKPQRGASKGLESMAESGANAIVRAIENTPFSSLAIPFPRFMANAMAFQYRYSPLGLMGAGEDLTKALSMRNTNPERSAELFRNARLKTAQSAVGMAGLLAAYEYRMDNPDSKWYEVQMNNGTTTDIRAVFPLGPYFAVADILARKKQGLPAKSKDAMEAVVGMKMPAGSQNVFVDRLLAISEDSGKDADKWAVSVGKMLGDFTGRFTQPFVVKNFYDYYDLMSEEGSTARDPNVIDVTATPVEQGMQAATQRLQSKIPGLKEELPEAIPRLREGPVVREGEFFNRLVGFRQVPNKTPVEREIDKLDIDPYRLYGGSSGDKEYDRAFIQEANNLVIDRIKGIIESPEYQKQSPLEQRIGLTDAVREMTAIAREITKAKMTDKNILGVYKMRFDKLPEEARMFINREYAKDHDGKTLEETRDYMSLDQYEAMIGGIRQYALGGVVGKSLVKSAIKKSSKELFREMQEGAVKAIKSVEEPPVVPKEVMDEALPAPKPVQDLPDVEAAPPANKIGDLDVDPDLWKKAQEKTKEFYGGVSDELKSLHPQHYDNTVFQQYQSLSKNWDAPKPHKDVGDIFDFENEEGVIEFGAKDIKKDWELNASEIDDIDVQQPSFVDQENISLVQKGDLRNLYTIQERDAALSKLKKLRRKNVDALKATRRFDENDSIVIGKSIGEFRKKFKREVDPANEAEVNAFNKIVKAEQKNYDALKRKYKDTPAITLYHGQRGGTEAIRKSGFMEPAKHRKKQLELNIGAPSFTRDINMNFEETKFGGKKPENYVAVKMPYADYEFSRVNMSDDEYMAKDLNTVAQVITGTDEFRPLSLPSKSFTEMEDAIVEAEKLKPKADEFNIGEMVESRKAQQKKGDTIADQISEARIKFEKTQSVAEANKIYSLVRKYMVNALGNAERTSTKAGIGQRYRDDLIGDDFPVDNDTLYEIKDILEENGSYQRANAIDKLAGALYTLKKSNNRDDIKKAIQQLISIPQKEMAKGGLAARK